MPNRIFSFLLCFLLVLILSGCRSEKTINGVVIDYDTNEAVADALVTTERIGWGRSNGQIVWDKIYTEQTVTDRRGEFSIRSTFADSVIVNVQKEGYVHYQGWHAINMPVNIKIKQAGIDDVSLPLNILEIGMQKSQPYGWIFAEKRKTFDPDEADIFPVFGQRSEHPEITLQVMGNGGIQVLWARDLGITSDFLVYPDMASEEGYTRTVAVRFKPKVAENTQIFFIRTRDGQHYAKGYFNPASYTTVGSEQDAQQGTWGILLEYVYNPDKSRSLPYRK
jgi:hypothetical protein